MDQSRKTIGRILLERRRISSDDLERVLGDESAGGRLASRLAEQGTISEVDALKALSEQHGIPGIDLSQICLRLDELELLPREIAEKHLIIPVLSRDDRLFVAMGNPAETKVIDELEFVTGKKVYPYVALQSALTHMIQEAYDRKACGHQFFVGRNCPREVLTRFGIDASGSEVDVSDTAAASATAGSEPPAHDAPGVVVDDTLHQASRSDEVEDSGFGEVSPDLSVVGERPGEWPSISASVQAKTILVVDDEPEIVRMLRRLLEARGYRVLDADRGLAALLIVKDRAPDVIILDAILPEVHGFEIARRIKGSKRYGHIPIIMISAVYRGWRYAEDLKQSCGVEYFIEKPFKINEIVDAVEHCVSDSAASLAQAPGVPEDEALSEEAEKALAAGVAAYRAGRAEEAVAHLLRGTEIDPLAYRLHLHLGLLYGKLGRVYEAIGELEKAIGINSRHFPAVKNLAVLYQKAGFRNKAAEMWERSLSLAPDDATRKSIKEHLINLL
ncbi:MAG: response regulator [Polyangiaceae bacterium]|nr:response regulator [Polyangiaceae bacterium]